MVGAVVVRDGAVVGRGYHARVGGPHAEVVALRKAGDRARRATLFVTLEPCDHHGRTPPCTEAILAAGISRVVCCHLDPDPRVSGRGVERLRSAGVAVEVGRQARAAVALNLAYLIPKLLGRPFVTLKWAMSLDGRIATATGESQWISSAEAREQGLALREEHDAILVGSGTVLADDPRLTRRLGRAPGPIVRVVLDRRLRTPPGARLFTEQGPVLVYTAGPLRAGAAALEEKGARLVVMPAPGPSEVLQDLLARGVRSVLIEGGAEVLAAFVEAGLYDRVWIDLSPRLIGGRAAPAALGGSGISHLADAPFLEDLVTERAGGDVLISGLRRGCLQDSLSNVVE